jgi:3-hydroxyacyl-[acyl-carrier-protein] dehydratase
MRTFVEPGSVLRVEAELEHDGSGFAITRAKIMSEGRGICDSNLTFRIMPFPNDALRDNMLDRFSQIYPSPAE